MSKYLLILTTAAAIGASYLFAQSVLPTRMAENERTYEAINEMLADQLAASGLNEAADWLTGQITMPTNQEFTAEFEDGGRYTATIQPNGQPNQVVVRSTGIVEGSSGDIERVREVVYELGGGTGNSAGGSGEGELPEFMSFGLLTQNSIAMSGSRHIGDSNGPNFNIHTNGGVTMSGFADIYGFLSYVTSKSFSGVINVRAPENPDGRPDVFQASTVGIPSFRASDYAHLATETQNHYTLSGNNTIQLGTRDNPSIIYVPGNISISGYAHFKGYGIFISDGNINLSGSIQLDTNQYNENSIAFYTSQNVDISGYQALRGQIFAGGQVAISGSANFCGSITARSLSWSGYQRITHCGASPALTEPIWPSEDSPGELKFRPISYRSW